MECITKENLINVVCKWMDYHNSDESYITETSNGRKYINGDYQTDLRSHLSCKETHESSVRGRNCNKPFVQLNIIFAKKIVNLTIFSKLHTIHICNFT